MDFSLTKETLHRLGLLLCFLLIVHKLISNRFQQKKQPPGPPSLPILGHFHLLRKKPIHLFLNELSNKYGSVFFIRLGSRPALVISSPSAIEECCTKNDIVFANRPHFASRRFLEYNFTTLVCASYGHHWRNLRRLSAIEIFSSARLQISSGIREEEIGFLVKQLLRINSLEGSRQVELTSIFYILTFNIMMKMVAGRRYFDDEFDSDISRSMSSDLRQVFSPRISRVLGDFFPTLRLLSFFKAEKKTMELHRKRELFIKDLFDSCQRIKAGEERPMALIDVLLSMQESEPDIYTNDVIKGIILVMLVSGTETSASTLQAAVAHLIAHPKALNKAREEIDTNVGQSRLVNDADLSKLPYVDCILNETIRLGSTGPIIPPHESSGECTVGGYNIPPGTMLLINAWALHRDPKLWEEPDMFKPERFLGTESEKGGYKFIPFGFGRRRCPGEGLAMRLMALSLGTLIQCFEWEKPGENRKETAADNGSVKVVFRPREALASALAEF